jgi:hypothetical protein
MATRDNKFVPLLFCCCCWLRGSRMGKKIRDPVYKHPGSAKLMIRSLPKPGKQRCGSGSRIFLIPGSGVRDV